MQDFDQDLHPRYHLVAGIPVRPGLHHCAKPGSSRMPSMGNQAMPDTSLHDTPAGPEGRSMQDTGATGEINQGPGQGFSPMAEEPVEILVQLAERGEIDPWNIDIVDVTDRFLDELERRKELDLRVSGRTLFYAATLLRMKSEYLDEVPEEEAEDDGTSLFDEGFDFDGEFAEGEAGPIERLEREIRRRLDRKRLRKSPVTLFELITELKNAEREQRRRQRYTDPFGDHLISADDVVGIAHDEGYQEAVMDIMAECEECVGTGGIVTLSELCSHLAKSPPEIYIPLLFLMSEGRVNLWQEEFFGELFIASAEGKTVTETGTAG